MVERSFEKGGEVADGCSGISPGDAASQNSCDGDRDQQQLTKEKLNLVFSEGNPHKQFE